MMFVEDEKKEKTKKKKELNPVFTNIHLMLRNRLQCYSKSHFMLLGQNFEFSSSFFGRFEDTKKTFRN